MAVWPRVARVLNCLSQKYNDPYHLLLRSEKAEICDQGWPGYSTASVRSTMTPTICCQDQRRWKLSGCPQVTSVWTITSLSNLELVRIRAVWPCLTGMALVQIRAVCPCPTRVETIWIRTFCHSVQPAWNWSGSELSASVWPALSAPVQPARKRSGSELSAILSNQYGTDQDRNCLPLSDQQHDNRTPAAGTPASASATWRRLFPVLLVGAGWRRRIFFASWN